ncbi:MAG: hypothetical protein JSV09_12640, partial [Thermoplasmata archaeon]
ALLDVYGTNNKIRLSYDGSNYADMSVASDGELTIQTTGTDEDIKIRTGSFDNAIFIDDSASRIGIGTTSPRYKLHVKGNLLLDGDTGPALMLWSDSTSGSEDGIDIYTNGFNDMMFRTATAGTFSHRIRVLGSNGNIRIGSALTPTAKLDVTPEVTDSTDYYGIKSGIAYTGPSTMSNWYGMYVTAPIGGGVITNKYALVTDSGAGNVGIGTTGPGKALEVNSADGYNLRLTYSDINGGAANYADFLTSNSMLTIQTSGTIDDIEIRTGSFDNAIYIDESASAVGIGTSSPQRSLHISGVMRLEPQSAAPSPAYEGDIYMHDGTGTPAYSVLRVYDGLQWNDLW